MKSLLFLILSVTALRSFAGLQEDFDTLKNSGKSFQITGVICEEVTHLRYLEQYPEPDYRVLTGITYSEKDRVLGELDLIVFENKTQTAILIGEVKCWRDPADGLAKAHEQRERFLKNVKSSKGLEFHWLSNPKEKFTKKQFNKTKNFISISQLGSRDYGFDVELDYTLDELMQMRQDIIACQNTGECVKPQK